MRYLAHSKILTLLLAIYLIFGTSFICEGAVEQPLQPEEEMTEISREFLDDLKLEEIQGTVDRLLPQEGVDLEKMVQDLMSGEQVLTKEYVKEMVYQVFFSGIDRQRTFMMQIILLVIVSAFFANFTHAFGNGQVGEIGFYIVYLLLFVLLLESFGSFSLQLRERLNSLVTYMQALTPAYYLAVATASGISTAALFYQLVLLLVYMIQKVIVVFLLPCVNLYVLLEMVNHLSKEDVLTKLAELLRTVVEWSLKTLMGVVVGLQIIQGLVAPVMDSLKRTAIGKTASAIPGVGNLMNSVTEIVLTGAVLVKNCLGVTFVIVLLLWGLTPLLQYTLSALMYKLMAALSQPVSDRRMVNCLSTMGEGCVLLMKVLFTAQIMSMITIVVLAVTFGGR